MSPEPDQPSARLQPAEGSDGVEGAVQAPLPPVHLVPEIYAELRKLARARMRKTPPGNTLQPTALVHDAFLRIGGTEAGWNSSGHFFAAAAEAMRQILVEQARRKAARKHGGGQERVDVQEWEIPIDTPSDELLALDRALRRMEEEEPRMARIVMLRYFAGLTREETAAAIGLSVRTVDRDWRYIVARLHRDVSASLRLP